MASPANKAVRDGDTEQVTGAARGTGGPLPKGTTLRFIAKYRRHKRTVREHIKEDYANGKSKVIQHGVTCEWQHGGLFNHEKELGARTFRFKGTLQEQDEATPVDPVYGVNSRLSVFDTDLPHLVSEWQKWDSLEGLPAGTIKKQVEDALLSDPEHGT